MAKKRKNLDISASREFILSENTQFIIKEAYKVARTNLTFALAPCDSKIIAFTSASAAEGKSTNCLNIAITMAEMGKSVLLIDADMRRSRLHSLLKIRNEKGLSSLLGGITKDNLQVVSKKIRDNLDVITAGSIPPNPAELLGSYRMDKLLKDMGVYYDYIFIDVPPVLFVSDALVISNKIAGFIFVVKEGSTTHPEIQEAIKKIKMTNGKILGFVKSNCAPKGKGRYSLYNYKYKSYRGDK